VQAARSFASRAAPGGAGVLTQHHKRSVSLHGSSGYSTRAVLTARALGLGLVAGQGQGCVACGPDACTRPSTPRFCERRLGLLHTQCAQTERWRSNYGRPAAAPYAIVLLRDTRKHGIRQKVEMFWRPVTACSSSFFSPFFLLDAGAHQNALCRRRNAIAHSRDRVAETLATPAPSAPRVPLASLAPNQRQPCCPPAPPAPCRAAPRPRLLP